MIKLVHTAAVLMALGIVVALVWPSTPSLSKFCEDIKTGKAGTAGDLSKLVAQEQRALQKLMSDLNRQPATAEVATQSKEPCP